MKYGYTIDNIEPGMIFVTYFRNGYPEHKLSIEFSDGLTEEQLHKKVHRNRPKEFWAAIDLREEGAHLQLQHLVGQTFTKEPDDEPPADDGGEDNESDDT